MMLNIFKKKKAIKPSFAPAAAEALAGKKATEGTGKKPPEAKLGIEEKLSKKAESEVTKPKAAIPEVAWRVLKSPHVTEKATDLTSKNQYVFKILPSANKADVKKAIEEIYGVDVLDVKIINISPKRRRLGRTEGWRKGYKKAIARIKEGQKIEVLPR